MRDAIEDFAESLAKLTQGETFEFMLHRPQKSPLTIEVTAKEEGYSVKCIEEWEFPTENLITLINDLENLEE